MGTLGNDSSCFGITEQMLRDEWHRHTDSSYRFGRADSYVYNASPVQEFLRRLKFFAEDYYRLRKDWTVTYEDIYYLAEQLYNEESGNMDNPAIEPFRREFVGRVHDLFVDTQRDEYQNLNEISNDAMVFIKCAVSHYLSTKSKPIGFDFIIELLRSNNFGTINIFTLNHDIILEKALNEGKVEYCDGFDKLINNVRWFEPALYDQNALPHIFKLHGSINWMNLQTFNFKGIGIPNCKDNEDLRTQSGEILSHLPSIPIILSGTYNKENRYYYDIIAEMHWRFFQALRYSSTSLIIIAGYGWSDRSINGRLREWILSRQENQFLLIHQHPEEIKNSKSLMWNDFDWLFKQGKLKLLPKWPKDLKSGELTDEVKKIFLRNGH